MRKVISAVLAAVLLITGLLAGCGPETTQTYNYTDFTRIEVGYAFNVEVIHSNSYSISITAPEDLFESIKVSKEGETLKIEVTSHRPLEGTKKAEINMPDLRAINFSGATKGTIKGFSSSDDFSVVLSGASSLKGDLKAGNVNFGISGVSTVKLNGSAQDINVDASGASHIGLSDFSVRNADVTLSGASDGTVNLDGRLDADLSGASDLKYVGKPTMGDISLSGSSKLSD